MTIDIEALIQEVDEDGSGEIEFGEFKEMLA
jgi:Ca2+-binding EF-hand superfamily protein